MTEKYTAEQVLDVLAKVVAEKEDFVYRLDQRHPNGVVQCNYTEPDGSPSCIVGHVLAELDSDMLHILGELERIDGDSPIIRAAPLEITSRFTERAMLALAAAQDSQDRGYSWGTALIEARNAI